MMGDCHACSGAAAQEQGFLGEGRGAIPEPYPTIEFRTVLVFDTTPPFYGAT